jgi:hypothetical protein
VGFTIGSRGEVPGKAKTCEKIIIIIIIIVQFNYLLLVCCINSLKANYRCSTREYKIINITK